ncbi:MAG: Ig-like domain repeat protein, partial [Terracidiphilus sp.]
MKSTEDVIVNLARFFSRLAGLIALVVLTSLAAVAQTATPRLVTQKIDEANLTTLRGNIHPEANVLNDRGPVDDSAPVGHIVLLLKRSAGQQLDLDAFVDQLHNSQSENYHKWLTPADFGRRFGPADEDVAAVAAWLESKGFTVEDLPASKTHITFTGTVGQMRQVFHVDIHHLSVNGAAHQATMNEPKIPAALAAVVSGFRQLHDFGPKPANHFAGVFKKDLQTGKLTPVEGTQTAPRANFTNVYDSEDYYEVGPQDFYTIYNETPLLNNNINGAGVTIAVIEETQINSADPVSFRSQFGLPAYPSTPNSTAGGINYIYGTSSGVGGDTACTAPLTVAQGKSSGDEGEADIDVEWAGTTAPNAIIDFVACGTKSDAIGSFGTDLAAAHVANYLSSTVAAASLSYGECEVSSGNSTFYSNLWEQYAAQGQTIVVAAGDGGSLGCETLTNNTSVSITADSAYNISAGGTDFGDAYISNDYSTSPATTWWKTTNGAGLSSALSYIPETTWGGYCSNALFVSYLQKAGSTTFGSTYTPEAVCNSSYSTKNGYTEPVGGSGGVSAYKTIPTWQSVYGVGLYSSSTTHRNQPDISLFAGNGFWGHSLPYCESDLYPCTYSNSTDAYELEAGGTSYVAPQVAGLMALVNQKTSERQGQANYTIYGLAAQEYGTTSTPNSANLSACSGSAQGANVGSTCIFHDIAADTPSLQGGTIASQIIEPCTYASVTDCYRSNSSDKYGLSAITGASHSSMLAYYAGAGYNLATGLGSVNVANLINSWNTMGISFASTTTLSASASTVPYSTTANLTLTATVKATGRGGAVAPAGVVEFFDGGSTSGTLLGTGSIVSSCTGSGATTSCNGVATLSLASSTLTPGANSIVAYFEGDAANDASSTSAVKSVTVNSWPQTVTITSPNTGTYGTPYTLTATATSGLTTFTYSVVSGPATVSGSTLTFTGVGAVVVQATQAGNSTYASASAQLSITVSPATPTLTVASSLNPSTYGQSVTFTATISSGPTGTVTFYDSASGTPVSIGTGTISDGKATLALTTLTAGAHTITAGWAGNTDYNAVTSSPITQTVNRATTTITWAAPAAITYGTALSATQLDATATSNYGGVAGSSDPGSFAYTPASGTVLGAGSQTLSVTFTPKDTTDYTTATKTVTLTVNKATTTITWATPAAITYGTALSATQLDATATSNYGGVAGSSDPGTFAYTPAAGTVETAGSHTLSVTFTPKDATDYTTPAAKTVTLTVSKATPTIAWATPASVPYGTALSSTQLDATVTWNVGSTLTTVAGTFTYTPAAGTVMTTIGSNTLKVTFAPTDTTDYATPAAATVTLTVIKATPVITWATPAPITYGTTLSGTQLDATANAAGTFAYSPAAGTVLTAGSQTLSVTFTPTNSTDYTTATDSVTLTVNKATPTVSAWPTASAITYGQTLASSTLSGGTASATGTFAWTTSGIAPGAGTPSESVTFTPSDTTDYNIPTAGSVSVSVNKAALTVTASSASISYGSPVPAITPGYSGFVNGDSPASLTTLPTCSTTYTVGSAPGIYPTTCPGAVGANYSISYTAGTVMVTAASQTISFTPPVTPVNYGAPPITLSANASSGLPVTFSVLSGPATANGNILTITGPGTVLVAADQAGNADYTAATEVTQDIVVDTAPTFTELASSLNPSTYGQSVTFNALVSTGGVSPTGSITFNDAGATIYSTTVTPVQTSNLVAYSQANATAWTSDETGPAAPTVTADSGLDPFGGTNALQMAFPAPGAGTSDSFNTVSVSGAFAGQTFTASVWLNASTATTINLLLNEVGGSSASASNAVTVGTAWQRYSVSLPIPAADSSASSLELVLVNPSGQPAATINVFGAQVENATSEGPYVATYGTAQSGYGAIASFATSSLTSGSHPINAAYAGDSNDAASTSATLTQVVNDATPTLSLASSANPTVYSNPVTFTATISNSLTGTITFYDGSTAIGTGALSGGSASLTTSALTAGSHPITAAWAGNADYNPITSASITQTVNQATPTLTWPTPAPIYYGNALGATQLNATATWTVNGTSTPVQGTFAYSPTAGSFPAVGTDTLSVIFTPTDTIDYTAATTSVLLTVNPTVPAQLTTPAPGSVLTGSSVTFTWTAGRGPTAYELYLGTTGVGSNNLYYSGLTTATSASVTGLPTNGVTVY